MQISHSSAVRALVRFTKVMGLNPTVAVLYMWAHMGVLVDPDGEVMHVSAIPSSQLCFYRLWCPPVYNTVKYKWFVLEDAESSRMEN
jgi:hypothetical protein